MGRDQSGCGIRVGMGNAVEWYGMWGFSKMWGGVGGGLGRDGGRDEVGNDEDVRWHGSRNEMKDGTQDGMARGEG